MASLIRSAAVGDEAHVLCVDWGVSSETKPLHRNDADTLHLVADAALSAVLGAESLLSSQTPAVAAEENLLRFTEEAFAKRLEEERQTLHQELAAKLAAEAIRVKDAARDEGFAAGQAEGRAAAERELAVEIEEASQLVASLRQQYGQLLAHSEPLAIELAVEAIGRLLGQMAGTKASIVGLVRQVIAQRKAHDLLRIRVSVHDADLLRQEGLTAVNEGLGDVVELIADESVAHGGCIVETTQGTLDARLEIQLRRLLAALLLASKETGHGDGI